MRVLTVRQPWAEAIACGAKLIENRSQGFPRNYRGALAIHAGAEWSTRGATDPRIRALFRERDTFRVAVYRAVIAVAELVDVHHANGCCAPWGEDTYPPANPEARPPGIVTHLVLADVRRLERPIPARGALGLWTPDEDLRAELAEALR